MITSAETILSTQSILIGDTKLSDQPTQGFQSAPYRVEHFADPETGEDRVRPAAGEEEKIPCIKLKHSKRVEVLTINDKKVQIEQIDQNSMVESLYLVKGNVISVATIYDPKKDKLTIDLRQAHYVAKRGNGGSDSTSTPVWHAEGGWLHISERDEQAIFESWSVALAAINKRKRAKYEIIPLYPKPDAVNKKRKSTLSADNLDPQ